MTRYIIPKYAKLEAARGLKERRKNKAGMTKAQAENLGIQSGIERANQLIANKTISDKDARSVARFYQRFRRIKTQRVETALRLWGGRDFGRMLAKKFYGK